MRLSGKTALITGGTSGIGRATAEAFAREGAEVIVSGRDEQRGAEVVAAITDSGGTARFVRADLAAPESVEELARLVRRNGHGVDILVNNAGSFAFGPTESFPLADFEAMFATNVRAPFLLTAALAPEMAKRGGGKVINVSTMAAHVGLTGRGRLRRLQGGARAPDQVVGGRVRTAGHQCDRDRTWAGPHPRRRGDARGLRADRRHHSGRPRRRGNRDRRRCRLPRQQ
jgi:NAD(P)-dependent dehydrogenase (short-subunit alcohol dehydrogenase family)